MGTIYLLSHIVDNKIKEYFIYDSLYGARSKKKELLLTTLKKLNNNISESDGLYHKYEELANKKDGFYAVTEDKRNTAIFNKSVVNKKVLGYVWNSDIQSPFISLYSRITITIVNKNPVDIKTAFYRELADKLDKIKKD